ncbi:Uncharacterised protein [Serratia odorifera]|uniref:Uncharacterized protein n=1 Tax=Serratia odorifera TaxID=618 RepID=A0A447KLI1_SEROD|nr:Uncharacterised protein [Serratia odorifera]
MRPIVAFIKASRGAVANIAQRGARRRGFKHPGKLLVSKRAPSLPGYRENPQGRRLPANIRHD